MDENIEVVPSEENGNIPVDAPNEQPEAVVPADNKEPVEPTEPEEVLYELPDGRKVDASTLQKEWKENFYPEYTRKSQELAKLTKSELQINEPSPVYKDPEWVPDSYEELLRIAEERVLTSIEQREKERIESERAIENEVVNQLNEIKKIDPTLNENSLFVHANKYGFKDLKLAHQNMKDMSNVVKKTQTTTAQNIAKRNDPVSVTPGAIGQRPDPSQFSTAIEYMRSLKN